MPLPLLFIGVAAATGGLGAGKAIKAGMDASHAKRINRSANEIVEASAAQLNAQRFACGKALRQLGGGKTLCPQPQHQRLLGYIFED